MHADYISWSLHCSCCGIFPAVICKQIYADCTSFGHSLQLSAAGKHSEGLWAIRFHCCLDRTRWYVNAIFYSFPCTVMVIVDHDCVSVLFLFIFLSWSFYCTTCMITFKCVVKTCSNDVLVIIICCERRLADYCKCSLQPWCKCCYLLYLFGWYWLFSVL